MSFHGWTSSAIDFFEGLEADNSKAYWLANKDIYERDVRGPMDELLAEMSVEFGEPRVFRPYRDVRFSRDKSPYKTNIAATIGDGYIHCSARGLGAGAGMYHMAADQLGRYRDAVAADPSGEEVQAIVDELRGSGVEIYGSDALKTIPKGYPKDHPRVELLRYKGIVAMKSWPIKGWLATSSTRKRVVDLLHSTRPLTDWLDRNVGPSMLPGDDRRRG
ncbi:MAG TPA: DUF2461 domain-containing protein [Chloroflexota bacterium]|jgi:uncharacterized protein (TIGR02453 family)|nr:DUF2461 domain-containing protein [Chloroflexota bacterium]